MARTVRRADPNQQARNRKRIILGSIIGVVVIIVICIVSFYARLMGGPALPREVRQRMAETQQQTAASPPASAPAAAGPSSAPAAAPTSRASASAAREIPAGTPAFPAQVQQVRAAAQQGDTSQHTMYITDAELGDQLGEEARKHSEVQEVHGFFESGQAYLTARVNAKGHELNLTIVLRPNVADGSVRFDVDRIFVGKVAAPPAIAQKVQEEIGKRAAWFTPERTGLFVERIEIKSGLAVLSGRPVAR